MGLGNVNDTADADKPISTATQAALDAVQSDVDANKVDADTHIARTDNPHAVTAAQVGLGNVDNTADADKPISTATQTALDGKTNILFLNVADPRVGAGVTADIGTEALTNETPPRVFKKIDSGNTDWELLVITNDGFVRMQQKVDLDSARKTASLLNGELLWTSDKQELWIGDDITLGGISVSKDRTSDRIILVGSWGSAAAAGIRLQSAIQDARDLLGESADPVTVLISPGEYSLSADLNLDTDNISLKSSVANRVFSTNSGSSSFAIFGIDPLVKVTGGDIVCSADVLSVSGIEMLTGCGFYVPAGTDTSQHKFQDCISPAVSTGNGAGAPWGDGAASSCDGDYSYCISTSSGFAANGGSAGGEFYKCMALLSDSFGGGGGVASGVFVECVSTYGSFGGGGGGGIASGVFTNCFTRSTFGSPGSFGAGSGGVASGKFDNCTDLGKGFGGGGGTFSGFAKNCTAFDFSGVLDGELIYCKCSSGSFALVNNGKTRYCLNSDLTTDNQG